MAYGTATVPRVDKIVGPGNRFVAAAKALVAADCGIDFYAGPTEIVIVSVKGPADLDCRRSDRPSRARSRRQSSPDHAEPYAGRGRRRRRCRATAGPQAQPPLRCRAHGGVIVTRSVAQRRSSSPMSPPPSIWSSTTIEWRRGCVAPARCSSARGRPRSRATMRSARPMSPHCRDGTRPRGPVGRGLRASGDGAAGNAGGIVPHRSRW